MGETANGRHGDAAKRRESASAMKWQNMIAQGFSPGFDAGKSALKVAPEVVD
jgi:hypothetical protein